MSGPARRGRGADVVGGACEGRDAGESTGARGCGAGSLTRENLGASARRIQNVRGSEEPPGPLKWNVSMADCDDRRLGLTGVMHRRARRKEPMVRRSPARAHCPSWLVLPAPETLSSGLSPARGCPQGHNSLWLLGPEPAFRLLLLGLLWTRSRSFNMSVPLDPFIHSAIKHISVPLAHMGPARLQVGLPDPQVHMR